MAKVKVVTVNQLHKKLGKLIEQGNGKLHVCVDKSTFTDNRESDGVSILPVDGAKVENIYMADDDGGIKTTKTGLEVSRNVVVLHGQSGGGYEGVLSPDAVEDFIKHLPWSSDADDEHKTLVAGNIRHFAGHLRRMTGQQQ